MDIDRIFVELARESEEIITGIWDWRAAYPHSTFAEIEAAVDERLEGLCARLLGDLALASAAADGAKRPTCAECGIPMTPRSTLTRHLTVQGDQSVALTRRY